MKAIFILTHFTGLEYWLCEIGPFGVHSTCSTRLSFILFTQNIMIAHTLAILKFLKKRKHCHPLLLLSIKVGTNTVSFHNWCNRTSRLKILPFKLYLKVFHKVFWTGSRNLQLNSLAFTQLPSLHTTYIENFTYDMMQKYALMQFGDLQKGYQACARKEVLNAYGSILQRRQLSGNSKCLFWQTAILPPFLHKLSTSWVHYSKAW